MYAPPLVSYTRTVCIYDRTTTARRIAIAIEMGNTRWADAALTPTRTTRADSVAYATDDSGPAAKIASARNSGRSASSFWPVRTGRPTMSRRARRGASTGALIRPVLRERARSRAAAGRDAPRRAGSTGRGEAGRRRERREGSPAGRLPGDRRARGAGPRGRGRRRGWAARQKEGGRRSPSAPPPRSGAAGARGLEPMSTPARASEAR